MNTDAPVKLIFEYEGQETTGRLLPADDSAPMDLAAVLGSDNLRPAPPEIPNLAENQVVRHYTRLSDKNFGVDNGPYPLGSCTMKYNPKVHEDLGSSGLCRCSSSSDPGNHTGVSLSFWPS